MKKLIILLFGLFAVLAINAQRGNTTIVPNAAWVTANTMTLNGAVADTVVLPRISGEYDVSLQLVPALAGSGDSVHFSHVLYLSDSYDDDIWSSVSSADTVSSVTDADAIAWWADMKSLRVRAICLGLSTDTVTIKPYVVYKKHANE